MAKTTEPVDRILIRKLRASCIIGTMPKERATKQSIVIDISLGGDFSKAATSDKLQDAVDYKSLKNRVLAFVEKSSFQLLERLAASIAKLCLEDPRVLVAEVTVDKTGALTGAESVAVSVRRTG